MKRLITIILLVGMAVGTYCGPARAEDNAKTSGGIRYEPSVDFGICANLNWSSMGFSELHTVQGIRLLPQFSAGIGLGFQAGSLGVSIPLSLNLKYIILPERKVKPFITADGGWNARIAESWAGPFLEIGPGLRYRKFQCSLTYNVQFAEFDKNRYSSLGNGLFLRAGVWF